MGKTHIKYQDAARLLQLEFAGHTTKTLETIQTPRIDTIYYIRIPFNPSMYVL